MSGRGPRPRAAVTPCASARGPGFGQHGRTAATTGGRARGRRPRWTLACQWRRIVLASPQRHLPAPTNSSCVALLPQPLAIHPTMSSLTTRSVLLHHLGPRVFSTVSSPMIAASRPLLVLAAGSGERAATVWVQLRVQPRAARQSFESGGVLRGSSSTHGLSLGLGNAGNFRCKCKGLFEIILYNGIGG